MVTSMSGAYEIDPVLVEQFATGNGTVFVGAGISSASGMPLWGQLMERLKLDLGDQISGQANYLEIAELYETKHNRRSLALYLKDSLGDARFQLTKTHEIIVDLPVQRIYTTNFDDLLEQACYIKQANRTIIYDASQISFSDASKLAIIKLHGDLNHPRSLVITASDYYSYFSKNPAVADLLKVELQTRTVLFLGYSFSDFNLGLILGKVAAQSGPSRPLLYSLQLNPKPLAVQALNRRGVKTIELHPKPGARDASEAVQSWLGDFAMAIDRFQRRKYVAYKAPVQVCDRYEIPGHKQSHLRHDLLQRIDAGLHSQFRVIVVKGESGAGKTQLTGSIAAKNLEPHGAVMSKEVFERVIWLRADSHERQQAHTLDRILSAICCSVTSQSITKIQDKLDKKTLADRLLQEHRVIVVIEDLEAPSTYDDGERTSAQEYKLQFDNIVNWLEAPGPYVTPKSRIIVTSRSLILPGFVVEVSPLSHEEARAMIAEQISSIMLRQVLHDGLSGHQIEQLVQLTQGNPQAIKLALGLVNCTAKTDLLQAALGSRAAVQRNRDIDVVFSLLVNAVVEREEFGSGARRIAAAMLAFPEAEPVPSELLLEAARLQHDRDAFDTGLETCIRSCFIERTGTNDAFIMHRITRDVLGRNDSFKEMAGESERALRDFLLKFLRRPDVIQRRGIKDEYWDALVRPEMARVDPYWYIIKHVIRQPIEAPILVEFTMLLAHFMDSRFLNEDRIRLIRSALDVLGKVEQTEVTRRRQALLRIDALAWTSIEEGAPDEARQSIEEGLQFIDKSKDYDLLALAECWWARIASIDKKWDEAEHHMHDAMAAVAKMEDGKPWIRMRIKMMSGDLCKMSGNPQSALKAYEQAEALMETYGGEGAGYQISPRIGMALLDIWEQSRAAEQPAEKAEADKKKKAEQETEFAADQRFKKLVAEEGVAIGRLYGNYGRALIAAGKKSTREAITHLQLVRQEIFNRSSGNVLLKLTEELYERITKGVDQAS